MPIPKKSVVASPVKGKVATKRTASRKSAASSTVGAAEKRSKVVADEYAVGKRVVPPESPDLPPNATPLDILMMAMKRAYLLGGSIAAAPYAEKAAPYIHGKISSIELKNPIGGGASGSGKPVPFRIEFVEPQEKPHDN